MAPPSDQRGMAAWVVNLYIGCYVSLITKANIRYEGYLFHLGPHGEQVGLKKVKCFGTEGRQREGPQVSANFTILEYIFFRGSDIMDLQVIASPPPQSTSSVVPDDPAIIQPHGVARAAHINPSEQLILSGTPFQLNQAHEQAASNYSFWGSFIPPPPTNMSRLAAYYVPGLVGSFGRVSRYPPPPRSLVMASLPPVQQDKNQNVNTSVAARGSRFSEHHRPLLLGGSTGSPSTLPPLPPRPSVQSNNPGQFIKLVSNLSSTPNPTDGSSALSSVPMEPRPKLASSLPEVLNVNATPAPFTDETNEVKPTGVSFSKQSKLSPMITEDQSGPRQSSPSQSLETVNTDKKAAVASVMESLPSDSTEETQSLLKPTTKTMQGSTSSHRYKGQSAWRRDQVHRSLPWHRGHLLGKANVANGVALNTQLSSRNRAVGRGDGLQPKGVPLHNPGHAASHHFLGRGAANPRATIGFKEDFDFEAMNEKFNKKEVWDFFSKNSKAEADDDDKKMADDDVKGKAKEVHVKDDNKPDNCEDDFFDHLSYGVSDESDQVALSEQRKIDDETFGVEIPILQQDHGQLGSHSAGSSQSPSGGRGLVNVQASRGRRGRRARARGRDHLK
ncbi:protein decapping 5 isoform X1 [Capsicum galapagoense]